MVRLVTRSSRARLGERSSGVDWPSIFKSQFLRTMARKKRMELKMSTRPEVAQWGVDISMRFQAKMQKQYQPSW